MRLVLGVIHSGECDIALAVHTDDQHVHVIEAAHTRIRKDGILLLGQVDNALP